MAGCSPVIPLAAIALIVMGIHRVTLAVTAWRRPLSEEVEEFVTELPRPTLFPPLFPTSPEERIASRFTWLRWWAFPVGLAWIALGMSFEVNWVWCVTGDATLPVARWLWVAAGAAAVVVCALVVIGLSRRKRRGATAKRLR